MKLEGTCLGDSVDEVLERLGSTLRERILLNGGVDGRMLLKYSVDVGKVA